MAHPHIIGYSVPEMVDSKRKSMYIQYRTEQFWYLLCYHPDNYRCSDAVYWRGGVIFSLTTTGL